MKRSSRWWRFFVILVGFYCPSGYAFIEFIGLDDISIAAWNGSGGLQGSDDYCVVSKRSATSTRRVAFDVAAYGPSDASGNFVLLLESDTSQMLPITFTWTGNQGSYQMSNYSQTGYITPRQRGALDCNDPNSTASVTVTVASSDLASAQAGVYSGSFRIDSLQLGNPSQYHIQDFRIEIPELYQISDLDDIDLGSFDGVTSPSGEDLLCVFRNGSGTYSLSASGGVNPSDPFELTDGVTSVPFSIQLRGASGAYVAVQPGAQIDGLVGSPQQNCGGSSNAAVRVTVGAGDLNGVPSGQYRGIVYITARPE